MPQRVLVAVDAASPSYDRLYSYDVPDSLTRYARPGARVLVPFGKGKPRAGVIFETDINSDAAKPVKTVADIERGDPVMSDELLKLARLLHDSCFCTYGDAIHTVCPKSGFLISDSSGEALKPAKRGHIETVYCYHEPTVSPRLTEKQRAVTELVKDNPMTAPQICAQLNITRAVVERLAQKGILESGERTKADTLSRAASSPMPQLTTEQSDAVAEIKRYSADTSRPRTTLLYGVTGSGKTLVYIELIRECVKNGRAALVLVPEIALATQMIGRLRALFGERVGVLHSALSDTERRIQWENIKSGRYDVIVGTRSAVFAPAPDIGLIVIDEEQEGSYISDRSPRYDARVIAAYRARRHDAKLLLTSATPSIETYYKAKTGSYNLVALTARFGDAPLPEVHIADMRSELLAGNSHYISEYMRQAIASRLERGEQCILLLNRRGYRTISMCCSCQKIVKCPSCDTPLVIHKARGCYVCHYCGRTQPIEEICAFCGGRIKHTGIGTQKIEEELAELFPTARILRLDVDSASRRGELEKRLAEFGRGEYDMIIGTQMIAKGLDFPNVTLAGVLSVDTLLEMPSFRARERAFSLLTQVVGRSGRGNRVGEAIIQTIDPDRDVIQLAAEQNYDGFYQNEIALRQAHLYPPFCAVSSAGFVAKRESDALRGASLFAQLVEDEQRQNHPQMPIRILGPAPMRVAYINDLYRYRIVFKSRGDRAFREMLRECLEKYSQSSESRSARCFVDMSGDGDG